MEDILGQGGDGKPGPWPRRLAAIAVLLLVAGVVIWHLPRHRPFRRRGRRGWRATRTG